MDKKELERIGREMISPFREWQDGEDFLHEAAAFGNKWIKTVKEYSKRGQGDRAFMQVREWKKCFEEEILPISVWIKFGGRTCKPLRIKWTGEKKGYDAVYKTSDNQEKYLEVTLAATEEDQHNNAKSEELLSVRGYGFGGRVPVESTGTKHNRKFSTNLPPAELIGERMLEEEKKRVYDAIFNKAKNEYPTGTTLLVVYDSIGIEPYRCFLEDSESSIHNYKFENGCFVEEKNYCYTTTHGMSSSQAIAQDFYSAVPKEAFEKFESIGFVCYGHDHMRADTRIIQCKEHRLSEKKGVVTPPCWLVYPYASRT